MNINLKLSKKEVLLIDSCLDEVYEGLEMGDEIGTEILRIQRKVLAQTKKQVERRKVYG